MTEPTDAIRQHIADARAALTRERTPRAQRAPRPPADETPGDRALRELRARHGLVKRTREDR
jgi:hypothetical protein